MPLEHPLTSDRPAIPDFDSFTGEIQKIYNKSLENKDGNVATYIPQLATVDPEQFGVSICTIDSQRFDLGDYNTPFCLQSVSKPITYCLALELNGTEKVHQHVGREPSGQKFNEITLNRKNLPHNPMINAGAIICNALIHPDKTLSERFDYVMTSWKNLCAGIRPGYNNAVYHSEKETADRNFALAHFMRERGAFPKNSDMKDALDLYFQTCSIESTTQSLSAVAATLANGGICPITKKQLFTNDTVKNCLSLMSSCGMYDFSGEFAFTVGLPAKSGVSGGIMVVIPNVMGIALWSPRLDELGNSVRGLEFCKELVARFKLHNYDSLIREDPKRTDPRLPK